MLLHRKVRGMHITSQILAYNSFPILPLPSSPITMSDLRIDSLFSSSSISNNIWQILTIKLPETYRYRSQVSRTEYATYSRDIQEAEPMKPLWMWPHKKSTILRV